MSRIWRGSDCLKSPQTGSGWLPELPAGLLDWFADRIWPPVCPLSGQGVDRSGHLHATAWSDLNFLDRPWCASCGDPFPYRVSGGGAKLVCARCAAAPPDFDSARSPLVYDEASRPLVFALKNAGRGDGLPVFANWMVRAGGYRFRDAHALVPVPLHWKRFVSRRFNQSALLAHEIARRTGLPVETDWLRRQRATSSQAGKSAKGRRKNVSGAFRLDAGAPVKGRRFVLVDDVFTTGATANACARLLKRSGAECVHVVTLCRVVRPSDPTM